MCDVTRRGFLTGGAVVLAAAAEGELLAPRGQAAGRQAPVSESQPGKVDLVAPGVYFHEGSLSDTADAVCNNGWVILEDYVLVIDANFPAGAREIIGKIRKLTEKPIRFAFDTHHHGDHAYGNQVFVESGAVPIAHTGVIEEMKRHETGFYTGKPGGWEAAAKERADVRGSKLKPPSVLFPTELIFDDGKHRVELMHLGVAHTHGDAVAWLPNERILFTGDVCVNGPYNYTGDGSIEQWIRTLDAARKFGARVVCTGHGPRGVDAVLEDQQLYFKTLWDEVGRQSAGKKPADGPALVETVRAAVKGHSRIARYAGEKGTGWDPFPAQVAQVFREQTGQNMAEAFHREARTAHARAHGLEVHRHA